MQRQPVAPASDVPEHSESITWIAANADGGVMELSPELQGALEQGRADPSRVVVWQNLVANLKKMEIYNKTQVPKVTFALTRLTGNEKPRSRTEILAADEAQARRKIEEEEMTDWPVAAYEGFLPPTLCICDFDEQHCPQTQELCNSAALLQDIRLEALVTMEALLAVLRSLAPRRRTMRSKEKLRIMFVSNSTERLWQLGNELAERMKEIRVPWSCLLFSVKTVPTGAVSYGPQHILMTDLVSHATAFVLFGKLFPSILSFTARYHLLQQELIPVREVDATEVEISHKALLSLPQASNGKSAEDAAGPPYRKHFISTPRSTDDSHSAQLFRFFSTCLAHLSLTVWPPLSLNRVIAIENNVLAAAFEEKIGGLPVWECRFPRQRLYPAR